MQNRDSPQLIVEKIDAAIAYTYSGMEFFPDQLDFHQDLFDAYHMKGVLFGCPVPKRANYFYWVCPLAIMRFVGHWYLSAGIRCKAMICNVCGKDILECTHFPGQEVDGVIVEYTREGLSIEEVSIVDIPRDPQCRISEIKIPETFFDGMIPEGKAKLDDGQLTCHLCDIEPQDLGKFPLFVDLDVEGSDKARRKYMEILKLDFHRINWYYLMPKFKFWILHKPPLDMFGADAVERWFTEKEVGEIVPFVNQLSLL